MTDTQIKSLEELLEWANEMRKNFPEDKFWKAEYDALKAAIEEVKRV